MLLQSESFVDIDLGIRTRVGSITSNQFNYNYTLNILNYITLQLLYAQNQGCGTGSAKILPLPLPHRLFNLESNLAKKFCPFPNVDLSGEVAP